jgi:hypothetical protein
VSWHFATCARVQGRSLPFEELIPPPLTEHPDH